MCGEYGEKCAICGKNRKECTCKTFIKALGRPHYHAIIFGYEFPDKTYWRKKNDFIIYRSEELEQVWTKGNSEIGTATFESAAYVARYITKKVTGDGATNHYSLTDTHTGELSILEPEYCRMSTGGKDGDRGIGYRWFQKFGDDFKKDYIHMRGRKMRPPKYYDRIRKESKNIEEVQDFIEIKERRMAKAAKTPPETMARKRVKEHLAIKRNKKLIREI